MKKFISIIFATDENVTRKERFLYGFVYPLMLFAFIIIAAALFQ